MLWEGGIKIIRLARIKMVSFPLCSECLHFKAEKNLKLDANETTGKDYRKAIKVTLAFVSNFFTFSCLQYSFNEIGNDYIGSNAFWQSTQKLPNASVNCVSY